MPSILRWTHRGPSIREQGRTWCPIFSFQPRQTTARQLWGTLLEGSPQEGWSPLGSCHNPSSYVSGSPQVGVRSC